jgi:formate-dependent nitrite reductase cytochrome c552 subunit
MLNSNQVLAQGKVTGTTGSNLMSQFDHLTTGFDLTGEHRQVRCETCHVDGVFKGTPTTCVGCHSAGTRVLASAKSANHVLSSNNCAECHSTTAWSPASRFDHTQVTGSCASCHNNVSTIGNRWGTYRPVLTVAPATTLSWAASH